MENAKRVLELGVAGAILTFLSGLINSTPGLLVGAVWFGWPVTWLRRLVVAPQYNPWVVDWYGLVADIVFWAILVWIVSYLLTISKSGPARKPAKRKSRR